MTTGGIGHNRGPEWKLVDELSQEALLLKPVLKTKSREFDNVAVETTAIIYLTLLAARRSNEVQAQFMVEVAESKGRSFMAKVIHHVLNLTKEDTANDLTLTAKHANMASALSMMEKEKALVGPYMPTKAEVIEWIRSRNGLSSLHMAYMSYRSNLAAQEREDKLQQEDRLRRFAEWDERNKLEQEADAANMSVEDFVKKRAHDTEQQMQIELKKKFELVINQLIVSGEEVDLPTDGCLHLFFNGKMIKISSGDQKSLLSCKIAEVA